MEFNSYISQVHKYTTSYNLLMCKIRKIILNITNLFHKSLRFKIIKNYNGIWLI